MKKAVFVIMSLAVIVMISHGPIAQAMSSAQDQKAVVPLEGLDPVMLVQGKEVMGKEEISITRGGFQYWFANAENKAKFEKEPTRYEIQMGGSCPVVPGATGNPDLFVVHKERIYIFATNGCVAEFKADPDKFVKP